MPECKSTKKIVLFCLLVFTLSRSFAMELEAEPTSRIIVFGDSWAGPAALALQEVLNDNGHTDITVVFTGQKLTAEALTTPEGLEFITFWLDIRPDADLVYLSIGANDWLLNWTTSSIGTQHEANLFASIVIDVETIVDHILTLRPNAQILWAGYDYFRPIGSATPAERNGAQDTLTAAGEQFSMTKQGLSFGNNNGLLQVHYGFDGVQYTQYDPSFTIPPGDPTLPNPNLPSPLEAFLPDDNTHLIPEAYKVHAQANYAAFFASRLNRPDFLINAGLNDAWVSADAPFQGLFFTVFPDLELFFLSWFTFDSVAPDPGITAVFGAPDQRWVTGAGTYSDDTVTLNVELTSGGIFNTSEPLATQAPGYGTITIVFINCNEAILSYDFPSVGLTGEMTLSRVVSDNVAMCEALTGP